VERGSGGTLQRKEEGERKRKEKKKELND